MIPERIVTQSAISITVAVLSLLICIIQAVLFFRKTRYKWFGWSAAISLTSMIYAIGSILEYNATGSVNRLGGLLECTAVILLVHCLYGFTFTYFKINLIRYYHILAGAFHLILLILIWTSDYIAADRFITRKFIGLAEPFIELDLGPAAIPFELYIALSSIVVIIVWLYHKDSNRSHKTLFLTGMILGVALGIHDGLASIGVPTFQYLLEYGLFGFSVVILFIVSGSFIDISTIDKYYVIAENANEGIMMVQDGRIIFSNPACNRIIGKYTEETPVHKLLNLVISNDRMKLVLYYNDLLCSIDHSDPLILHINKNGEDKIIECWGNIVTYRYRTAILFIFRDMTRKVMEEKARKENEEKISRLEKMESIGLIAGGVAHDLNNVLSGTVSYPELILLDLPEDSPLRNPIKTMREAGLKAVAIVQDLLTMVRGVAVPHKALNLNEVITEYFGSAEYKKLLEYHPGVTVKRNLYSNLLNIKGSPVHLGKVVMNLISNACEAIEKSGAVVVSTINRYLDKPLKGYDNINAGEYVVLRVEDTGTGIAESDIERLFEPFFTKKVMGRSGTGLGLSVVWNTVQDHKGYINVNSDNNGTIFELYFPVTRDHIADEKEAIPVKDLYGNGEMILIVDDVGSQREILCHILEALNYKTKAFSSGKEAVAYLKENRADLIVLDMIMDPDISGLETYEKIRKIQPTQKAIIVSGFAETDDVRKTQDMGAGRFIKKPVVLEEFGLAIKEELGKHENRIQ